MDWTLSKEDNNLKPPSAADLGLAAANTDASHWKATFESEYYYPSQPMLRN
jgi:hypothetical protein